MLFFNNKTNKTRVLNFKGTLQKKQKKRHIQGVGCVCSMLCEHVHVMYTRTIHCVLHNSHKNNIYYQVNKT